jgi:O-antigen ligase
MYQTYATSDNYTANLSTRYIAFFILLDLIIVISILLGRFYYLLGGVALIFFAYLIINKISWGLYFIPISIATPLVIVPGPKLHLGEFTVFFLLCSFLGYSALTGEIGGLSFPRKYKWFLILFLASAFLSLINAPHPKTGLALILKQALAFVFVFGIVYNNMVDIKTLRKMSSMVIVAGMIASFYGIFQYYIAAGTIFPGHGPRIFGQAGGGYGALIGVAMVMIVLRILSTDSFVKMITYIIFLPMMFSALLLSRTRAWILGTIIATGLVVFWSLMKKQKRSKFILLLIVLILLVLVFWGSIQAFLLNSYSSIFLRQNISSEHLSGKGVGIASDFSLFLRLRLWSFAFRMFLQNPLTGIGVGNFRIKDAFRQQLSEQGGTGGWSDNHYVNIPAETGILGTLAWIYLAYLILSSSLNVIKSKDDKCRTIALGFIGGLTVFTVGGFFWNLTSGMVDSARFVLMISLLLSIERINLQNKSNYAQ